MNYKKTFVSAIMAGLCISFGAIAFLSVDSKPLGAVLFSCGLFSVLTFGFHLYTGKICYVFDNGRDYLLSMPLIWAGNLVGTCIAAFLVRVTRISVLSAKANALCQTKLSDGLLSLFVLGMLCNIFIYIAVEGYRRCKDSLERMLSVFFGVTLFILCGYEHCVADMFYFACAGLFSSQVILRLLVITIGNSVGGILFHEVHKRIAVK